MQAYFYTLIGRQMGGNANDWRSVMTQSMIPPGFGPGVKADASYPFFGLTQQWSGGPKARIFLPSNMPDGEGYYTRCIQYITDAPGGVHSVDFVWTWIYIAGHQYAPVQGPTTPPVEPPVEPPDSGDGLTEEQIEALRAEVQRMIDASLVPVNAQLSEAVKIGDKIGLQAQKGMVICAEGGGPEVANERFELTSRQNVGPWESFTLHRGH